MYTWIGFDWSDPVGYGFREIVGTVKRNKPEGEGEGEKGTSLRQRKRSLSFVSTHEP